MRDSLYMAWQYLRRHQGTTAILIASMTLIFFLPSALVMVVDDATEHFRSRASSTPLLVGARGSALELVLGTLYFGEPQPELMRMSQVERIRKLDLGATIPLHAGIRSGKTAIVGTTPDYYALRKLGIARGRRLEIVGECLAGHKVAKELGIDVGSRLPISKKKAFVLGDAPLRLHVVGVLAPTETPDDEAIFVNLKTVWIIAGLGHGHAANAKHGTQQAAEYTDITKENVGSFHFHGDESDFPITAIIVQPKDAKARTLLLGEYLSLEDIAQIVVPVDVMDTLLAKILQVRSYFIFAVALVSLVTLAVMALVIMLSLRLRKRELATMVKMGCSRFAITTLVGSQVLIVVTVSLFAAAGLTVLVSAFGQEIVRAAAF